MASDSDTKYICGKCRYKFTKKAGSRISDKCPYCGSDRLLMDKIDLNRMIKTSVPRN